MPKLKKLKDNPLYNPLKKSQFTVYYATGRDVMKATTPLMAVVKSMANREFIIDYYPTHVIDVFGNKYDINQEYLLNLIK